MEPEVKEHSSDDHPRVAVPSESPGSSSLLVQPILISSPPQPANSSNKARAPPSLIPISSFTNQFRDHTQPPGFDISPGTSSSFRLKNALTTSQPMQQRQSVIQLHDEADDVDEDMEMDVQQGNWTADDPSSPQISPQQPRVVPSATMNKSHHSNKRSISSSPLVSTSSHSITSGVKLHIHRASVDSSPPTNIKRPDVVEQQSLYSDESEGSVQSSHDDSSGQSSSNSANINSILNAIRSNTSLTIEEVPVLPTSSTGSSSLRYGNPEGEMNSRNTEFKRNSNDKVEVFIVPQHTPIVGSGASNFQVFSSPSPASRGTGRRGRPKRLPAVAFLHGESGGETPEAGGSRRTPRDRKPTKHFMPDFSRFRGFKKRGLELLESMKAEEASNEAVTPETPMSDKTDSEEQTPVKRRGRPSTGRARGRPRGSTGIPRRRKIPVSEDVDDPDKSKTDETSESEKASRRANNSDDVDTPTKQVVRTPRGARAARGGARGGRRITKAQKIQKAKLKKLLSNRKDSLQLFEEETRMSSDVKPAMAITQTVESEDASNSTTNTSTTTKQKKQWKAAEVEEQRPVTAETLFEYHWPVDDPLAEIFFLQEQVSDYLGVKSFKRKYPDLKRRTVEMAERDFLRGHKIVSETQCDLGLTALHSNHVLEIMFKDFPDKYEEYRIVVQERRDREYMKQKPQQSSTAASARDKGAEFMRRILNSCSSWNSKLNRERAEERSCYFDQQTFTMNIQKAKMKVLPPHATKMGYYPVCVLPGQYTDNYTKYSADELKYLPLNTVSYGPLIDNHYNNIGSDDSSDSDGSSSSSDDSSSSSDSEGSDREKRSLNTGPMTSVVGENGASGTSAVSCKTCEGDVHKNKDGQFEVLIQCTKCDVANHPSCLELSLDMLPFIKKYNWQCTDCKNCIECNDPADEDKMLFCDLCDRGYHIYCVGLRKVPTGRWHCRVCAICHSCATTKPVGDERGTEWHHVFKKGEKGAKVFSHSVCITCYKLFRKGQFCPSCNKSHQKIDDKTLQECRSCEKLIHKECIKRQQQSMAGILCDPCDANAKAKSKTKDSFVKQNFLFY